MRRNYKTYLLIALFSFFVLLPRTANAAGVIPPLSAGGVLYPVMQEYVMDESDSDGDAVTQEVFDVGEEVNTMLEPSEGAGVITENVVDVSAIVEAVTKGSADVVNSVIYSAFVICGVLVALVIWGWKMS